MHKVLRWQHKNLYMFCLTWLYASDCVMQSCGILYCRVNITLSLQQISWRRDVLTQKIYIIVPNKQDTKLPCVSNYMKLQLLNYSTLASRFSIMCYLVPDNSLM